MTMKTIRAIRRKQERHNYPRYQARSSGTHFKPALERLSQEEPYKFEASFSNITRPCLTNKTNTKQSQISTSITKLQ